MQGLRIYVSGLAWNPILFWDTANISSKYTLENVEWVVVNVKVFLT